MPDESPLAIRMHGIRKAFDGVTVLDDVDFEVRPGEVPVFWACGVTPQAAVMASKPPFAITHAPGHMFITDIPDSDWQV